MALEVRFAPEAQTDLLDLYSYIAAHGGTSTRPGLYRPDRRLLRGLCRSACAWNTRDEIRPGLRTIGIGRRTTIAFHLTDLEVVIDRILYGGRDLVAAFDDGED